MDKLPETIGKPLLTGVAAAILGKFILGYDLGGSIRIFNMSINAPLGIGLAAGGGALVGSTLSNYVLPLIPSNSWVYNEGMIIQPALTGAATTALIWLGGGIDNRVSTGYYLSFITGASANIAADYSYKTFFNKM